MPYANVGSERLYYEVEGEGPPLVLIRGLTRSLRFWDRLLPFLRGHFRILTYDHRGIGRSPIRSMRFSVKDLADDLAGVIDASGFERAHVFGLSLGGMVALRLALDHPGRVDKLVLGSTSAGVFHKNAPRLDSLAVLAVTARLPLERQVALQAPRLMSPAFCAAHPEVADSWVPHLREDPIHPRVAFQQALAAALHDVTGRLSELQAEVLLLSGDADRLIPHRHTLRLKRALPDAELQLLPGVGHDIAAEAPEAVAAHIKRFVLGVVDEGSATEAGVARAVG